jgi:hypothetical protein
MARQSVKRGERAKARTSRLALAGQAAAVVAIMALGVWAFQRGGYFRPIFLTADQVAERLPLDLPERLRGLIRVPGVEVGQSYRDQDFGIAIDRAGQPGSVQFLRPNEAQPAPPTAATDSAVAQIRRWRFVPYRGKDGPAMRGSRPPSR